MSTIKSRVRKVEKATTLTNKNKVVVISYPYDEDSTKAKEDYLKLNPHDKDAKYFVMLANFAIDR